MTDAWSMTSNRALDLPVYSPPAPAELTVRLLLHQLTNYTGCLLLTTAGERQHGRGLLTTAGERHEGRDLPTTAGAGDFRRPRGRETPMLLYNVSEVAVNLGSARCSPSAAPLHATAALMPCSMASQFTGAATACMQSWFHHTCMAWQACRRHRAQQRRHHLSAVCWVIGDGARASQVGRFRSPNGTVQTDKLYSLYTFCRFA